MPNTIGLTPDVTTRCAVFKIDLKGRFVYIDDAAENIFGASCDDLIGRSIFEFVSNGSIQDIENLLSRSTRYESFYQALPLTIRTPADEIKQFKTILTLNFIGGNPVNYQIILVPSDSLEATDIETIEKKFLRLINTESGNINYDSLAEIFCRAGGYNNAECYNSDLNRNLLPVGGWPRQNLDYTPPVYIETFYYEQQHLGFDPEDLDPIYINIDGREGEAAVVLRGEGDRPVLIHLHGSPGYSPSRPIQQELRLFADCWNRQLAPTQVSATVADRLSLLGRLVDAMQVGLAVIDKEFEFAYKNDSFDEMALSGEAPVSNKIIECFDNLHLIDDRGDRATFEKTPFMEVFNSDRLLAANYTDLRLHDTQIIVASSIDLENTSLAVFLFVPGQVVNNRIRVSNENAARILHNINDDLKPPLMVIEGLAKYLNNNYKELFEGNSRIALDSILSHCHLLNEAITGLQSIDSSQALVNIPESFDTKKVISDVVGQLAKGYNDNKYDIEIDPELPKLVCPQEKFVIIIRCLLDNAFKYGAEAGKPAVVIVYDKKDGYHYFAISDYGPGIPDVYHDKIFEPFFRIPKEAIKDIPGAGVGLNIALITARSMGGNIRLKSSQEGGATFIFTLPVDEEIEDG